MSVTLSKPCNLSQAPLSASLPQSLGTCVGLLGWADGLIVTTWRQWEGLMRNICFCVSTEPLIVQGKGYSAPIQTRHNENPSPPWAGWAYNIHPLLFYPVSFFPTPLLDFNSPCIHFAYCTYVTCFVPQIEEQWCAKLWAVKGSRATQSKHKSSGN